MLWASRLCRHNLNITGTGNYNRTLMMCTIIIIILHYYILINMASNINFWKYILIKQSYFKLLCEHMAYQILSTTGQILSTAVTDHDQK